MPVWQRVVCSIVGVFLIGAGAISRCPCTALVLVGLLLLGVLNADELVRALGSKRSD